MTVIVSRCDWGDIETDRIQALLTDCCYQLDRHFKIPFKGDIEVATSSTLGLDHPKTLVRQFPTDAITVLLSARDNFWCKFVYQFAHEYCHIRSDYENLMDNPNNWFHEALCELASIFVLKGMAVNWLVEPPFHGGQRYANKINSYVADWTSRDGTHLAAGETLSEWIVDKEGELRREPVTLENQRLNQSLIAYELLPLFESQPSGWNAVTRLPPSTASLREYLEQWYSKVEPDDKRFVSHVSEAFGYPII